MADVYIVALLGRSPAVLTELVWQLAVAEGHRIVGMEVWTTRGADGGEASLRALCLPPFPWRELGRLTELPALTATGWPTPPGDGFAGGPVSVGWFEVDGAALEDIRTHAESRAVEATLHDRVALLAARLPADVTLVGSLAGGRKTMSASLQSAFALRGRPGDRVVHVLLASVIEAVFLPMKKDGVAYWFPGLPADLSPWIHGPPPLQEQVALYDVACPPLPALLQMGEARQRALLGQPMAELLGALWARMRMAPRLQLQKREGFGWTLRLIDGQALLHEAKIGAVIGAIYAALVLYGDGRPMELDALALWLDKEDARRLDPAGLLTVQHTAEGQTRRQREARSPEATFNRKLSENLRTLREKLEEIGAAAPGFPIEAFLPQPHTLAIAAHARVEVLLLQKG